VEGGEPVSATVLTLPVPPSTNHLYRNVRGKGRVLNKDGRAYKETARMVAMGARLPLLQGDVLLTMTVYFPNRRRRDLSNCLKVIEDSLSGVAYRDDSQVAKIVLTRQYDNANPRAELTVEPLPRAA
jgi:crossover junction endodeoxyribonuclease RusA